MTNDVTLIATDPIEMTLAQNKLVAWCEGKITDCEQERKDAEATFNALHEANLNVAPARRAIAMALKRRIFYSKIKAALDAGYYIVPPFPVQTFAIRTKRAAPEPGYGGKWSNNDQRPQTLPIGEGRYVSPDAKREYCETVEEKNYSGNIAKVDKYWNTEFRNVGFPLQLAKPEIIKSVGTALQRKIFDSLGVLPAYRKADPIIVGQINHYIKFREPVTFFVAWWLNTEDL